MSLGQPDKFGNELKRLELHRTGRDDPIELVWVSDSGQPYVIDVPRALIESVGVLGAVRAARVKLKLTAATYEGNSGPAQ